jgi:HEPN domain-containing protein
VTDYKKKSFNKEYAIELLNIACGDLKSALALFNSKDPGRPENIIFMVQQSVEKSIKASLVHLGISFPLVHDLGILISCLPNEKYPPNGFALTELNPYASVRRYEEGRMDLSTEEVVAALDAGKSVQEWAKLILKTP